MPLASTTRSPCPGAPLLYGVNPSPPTQPVPLASASHPLPSGELAAAGPGQLYSSVPRGSAPHPPRQPGAGHASMPPSVSIPRCVTCGRSFRTAHTCVTTEKEGWGGWGESPPAAPAVPPGAALARSSAPALALICSIVEILMRTASPIHTIRLLQMIRSARRTAGAHGVSAVVQHRRADESTGRVKPHRWVMLIPPAPTLTTLPI